MKARIRRCVICHRLRRRTVMIPVHPAPPPTVAKAMGLREHEEPWCLACAQKVLDRMGESEYVWYSVTDGWPT